MNPDYENQLEAEVDRQIKGLPELRAPRTLTSRVMARIGKQRPLPWYRLAWQQWPMVARALSLGVMLALFGALCFGAWRLLQLPGAGFALNQTTGWFSGFEVIWNALGSLANAACLAFKNLGQEFLIACIVIAGFSYLTCVGLGTLVVRFAFSNIRRNSL
jgi:hypothetical protein